MQERGYAKRSWAMLTHDKGWIKPVLVLAAANLVPVAGALGTSGYMLEWARLTAWGVDAAPKQKNVQVGACIRSGWRAFVVALGWGVCLGFAAGVLNGVASVVPGVLGSLLQLVVSLAIVAFELFANVAIAIASVRTAIYEKIGAGYRVDRIVDMIRRDTQGFLHLVLFQLLWSLAVSAIALLAALVICLAFVPVAISAGYGLNEYAILSALSQTIGTVIVLTLVLGYAISIVTTACTMVFYNAVGLWMRQFDVAAWGRSEDPLPQTAAAEDGSQDERPQLPAAAAWEDPREDASQVSTAAPAYDAQVPVEGDVSVVRSPVSSEPEFEQPDAQQPGLFFSPFHNKYIKI